jgi:hypothetical protein
MRDMRRVSLLAFFTLLDACVCQHTRKRSCTHSVFENTISRDLGVFETITRNHLEAGERLVEGGWHFAIVNNTLYYRPIKNAPVPHHAMVLLLVRAMCRYEMPDVEFMMFDGDFKSRLVRWPHKYVMFANSKDVNYDLDFLVPYQSFFHYDDIGISTEKIAVPWNKKLDKAVWRGTTTGGLFTGSNWKYKQRTKLVKACQNHTQHCDVGYVDVHVQATEEAAQEMAAELRLAGRISMADMSR